MTEAFLWGALGASTLLAGALVVLRRPPGQRLLGLIMGFGSGVLLSAVAYELIEKAINTNDGLRGVTLGFLTGSLVFTAGDAAIDRIPKPAHAAADAGSPAGLPIMLGALLDGIPESAVLGLTLLQDGRISAAMLVAVTISNLPEGIAATVGLKAGGWTNARIIVLWTAIVLVSAAIGYAALDGASPYTLAIVLGFAAGAILTMLATSMMPQAYRLGGRLVGNITVLGFLLALAVNWLAG